MRGADGGVVVDHLDEPPGSGELVQMRATSVCASDFLYLRYGTTKILGHELAGVRADGTAVVVEAMYGCMECDECQRGSVQPLPDPSAAGARHHDRRRDERTVPRPRRPADHAAGRDSTCATPRSSSRPPVSWHALRLAGAGPDTRVAIVGAGALGLLAAAGARRMGVTDLALEARHPFQIEAAERLGVPVGTDGLYDVVVEAAGTVESLARAIDLVGPRGTVVVLGVHVGSVDVNWSPLFHREARLLPSLGYCAHDGRREMEDAAAMLAADPEIARTVITHRFPIDDAVEAFRVAGDRSTALDPSRDRTVKPCDGGQLTR